MRSGRWLPLLGVVMVAACAAPAQQTATVAAPTPPDRIDGRYQGIGRLTRAAIRGCPRSGRKIITVEGNSFSTQYRGERASYALAASVSPDGNIHGSDSRGNIEGQISGRHMDLTVSSQFCEVRYALERM